MIDKIKKYLLFLLIFTHNYLASQTFEEIEKLKQEYKQVLERQALQKPKEKPRKIKKTYEKQRKHIVLCLFSFCLI